MVRLRVCCAVFCGVYLGVLALAACSGGSATPGSGSRDGGRHTPHIGDAAADATLVDAGPPPRLYAKRFVVNIRVAPDNESFRQGYLRGGAIVQAKNSVPLERGKPGCLAGFWELESGGFVCNVRDVASSPPKHWDLKRRQAYFEWAREVIDQLRGVHPQLEAVFDEAYKAKP